MYKYHWKNNEANFGPPLEEQVSGGTHITFEIILKKDNQYIALRRPKGIPEHELPSQVGKHPQGLLYFCHNLIRYGESIEQCVKRVVKEQAGVEIKSVRVIEIESVVQEKDHQWAFTPYIIVELANKPKTGIYGNEITEVVEFTKENIPEDFAWWTREELKRVLEKFD